MYIRKEVKNGKSNHSTVPILRCDKVATKDAHISIDSVCACGCQVKEKAMYWILSIKFKPFLIE